MPRQPRYFVAGIPQHVVVRGVDRQATFFSPDDYQLFLDALERNLRRYEASLHAYVLMTNHVHLLVTPRRSRSIARLMQGMGRDYVQVINRRYRRTGTLWESRYKASVVQADDYLLACQRYIELNPVRAGMVDDPAAYPHSSYRSSGMGARNRLLEPHDTYLALGATRAERCKAYRRLFENALDRSVLDALRTATNACQPIGNERFTDQIESMLERRVRPGRAGRPKKLRSDP